MKDTGKPTAPTWHVVKCAESSEEEEHGEDTHSLGGLACLELELDDSLDDQSDSRKYKRSEEHGTSSPFVNDGACKQVSNWRGWSQFHPDTHLLVMRDAITTSTWTASRPRSARIVPAYPAITFTPVNA